MKDLAQTKMKNFSQTIGSIDLQIPKNSLDPNSISSYIVRNYINSSRVITYPLNFSLPPQSAAPQNTSGICLPISGFFHYQYFFVSISDPTTGYLVTKPPDGSYGSPPSNDPGPPHIFNRVLSVNHNLITEVLRKPLTYFSYSTASNNSGTAQFPPQTQNNSMKSNSNSFPDLLSSSSSQLSKPLKNRNSHKGSSSDDESDKLYRPTSIKNRKSHKNAADINSYFFEGLPHIYVPPPPVKCVETPNTLTNDETTQLYSPNESNQSQNLSHYNYTTEHRALELWEGRIQRYETEYDHPAMAFQYTMNHPTPKLTPQELEREKNYKVEEIVSKVPKFWPKRPWDKEDDLMSEQETRELKDAITLYEGNNEDIMTTTKNDNPKNGTGKNGIIKPKTKHIQKVHNNPRNSFIIPVSIPALDFTTENEEFTDCESF